MNVNKASRKTIRHCVLPALGSLYNTLAPVFSWSWTFGLLHVGICWWLCHEAQTTGLLDLLSAHAAALKFSQEAFLVAQGTLEECSSSHHRPHLTVIGSDSRYSCPIRQCSVYWTAFSSHMELLVDLFQSKILFYFGVLTIKGG